MTKLDKSRQVLEDIMKECGLTPTRSGTAWEIIKDEKSYKFDIQKNNIKMFSKIKGGSWKKYHSSPIKNIIPEDFKNYLLKIK